LSKEKFVSRAGRKIARDCLQLLFKLWFGRRHGRLCLERVHGLTLLVPAEVFNPALFGSSLFLANYLRRNPPPPGSSVLDVGCGSGLLGLELARRGLRVLATDLNPQAVWASQVNAHLNGCESFYEVRQGSLYGPVEQARSKFDLIVLNPPYYPQTPATLLEAAFQAGAGLETLTGMLTGAATYLRPDGRALAVLSSTIPLAEILSQVEQAGLDWQIVARKRYWAEWHLIYELRLKGQVRAYDT
jgi:release factor glutamine methyltransferase